MVVFNFSLNIISKLEISEFHYRTTLDASTTTMPRLYFLHKERENEEELTTILSKGQTWCKERQAYLIVKLLLLFFLYPNFLPHFLFQHDDDIPSIIL